MLREQYCWIGNLYLLDCDVSEYVSDVIDALEENSKRSGFKRIVDSTIKTFRKEMDDGVAGEWFADGF